MSCFYKNNTFEILIIFQRSHTHENVKYWQLFITTIEVDCTFIILLLSKRKRAIPNVPHTNPHTYNVYEGHASDVHKLNTDTAKQFFDEGHILKKCHA